MPPAVHAEPRGLQCARAVPPCASCGVRSSLSCISVCWAPHGRTASASYSPQSHAAPHRTCIRSITQPRSAVLRRCRGGRPWLGSAPRPPPSPDTASGAWELVTASTATFELGSQLAHRVSQSWVRRSLPTSPPLWMEFPGAFELSVSLLLPLATVGTAQGNRRRRPTWGREDPNTIQTRFEHDSNMIRNTRGGKRMVQ
jgi:hypothetical protein